MTLDDEQAYRRLLVDRVMAHHGMNRRAHQRAWPSNTRPARIRMEGRSCLIKDLSLGGCSFLTQEFPSCGKWSCRGELELPDGGEPLPVTLVVVAFQPGGLVRGAFLGLNQEAKQRIQRFVAGRTGELVAEVLPEGESG